MIRHLTFLSFALCGISLAGPLYTGPFGPDGTWNLYQLVENNLTWEEARKQAESLPAPTGDAEAKGHLITFSSAAENHFARALNREEAWCGLTDDERFGGREAGSHPRNGWKWADGEPLTYSNWKSNQPDDWRGEGSGEDGVLFDFHGRWSDNSAGTGGQSRSNRYFAVEWESHSKTPVAGAIPLERVWPEKPLMPAIVPGKWNARWVSGYVKLPDHWIERPRRITDAHSLLTAPTAKSKDLVELEGSAMGKLPWLLLSTQGGSRQGWLPAQDGALNFPKLVLLENSVGSVVGKIHVEKAGAYTFLITAEDTFALRIGGMKWKSAGGDGFIDPLDPLTVTQPNGTFDTKALAVIDLPAGDHVVEALWTAEGNRSELTVLSAPGVHLTAGSTTDWRPLGYLAGSGKIPSLGITDAGWTVECSMASDKALGLQDGLVKLELDLGHLVKTGVNAINFADAPETHPAHFPDASVFPNDRPNAMSNYWPLRASARLVVPQDGAYQIGLHAAGLGALRIKGDILRRASQTAQNHKDFHQQAHSFDFNGQTDANNEPKIFTEWELKKGEYDIEIFYVKNIGPASLAVFSCLKGPYPPGLLSAGGAKLADDVPGLLHATR